MINSANARYSGKMSAKSATDWLKPADLAENRGFDWTRAFWQKIGGSTGQGSFGPAVNEYEGQGRRTLVADLYSVDSKGSIFIAHTASCMPRAGHELQLLALLWARRACRSVRVRISAVWRAIYISPQPARRSRGRPEGADNR